MRGFRTFGLGLAALSHVAGASGATEGSARDNIGLIRNFGVMCGQEVASNGVEFFLRLKLLANRFDQNEVCKGCVSIGLEAIMPLFLARRAHRHCLNREVAIYDEHQALVCSRSNFENSLGLNLRRHWRMYGHDGCALKDLTIRSLTFFDTISCDVQNVIDEKITRAEDITPLIDINFDEPLACETCFPDGTLSFYRNVQHLFRLATNLRKSAVELVEHRSSWMLERGSLLAEAELLNFDDVPIHDCNFSKYAQYLIEKIRAFVAKGERPWVPSIDDPIFVTLPYRY